MGGSAGKKRGGNVEMFLMAGLPSFALGFVVATAFYAACCKFWLSPGQSSAF